MPSKTLAKLADSLEELRKLDDVMPIQMALCFITVAQHSGLTMKDLSDMTGLSQSSCSRNIAALSKWHRYQKPGHDVVRSEEDPTERRRKIVFLTAKGERIIKSLKEKLADE